MSWSNHGSASDGNGRRRNRHDAQLDSPDAIREKMAALRYGGRAEAIQVSERAKQVVRWQYYVDRFPFACVGLAAVGGFLLVPSKQEVVRPSQDQLEQLAKEGKLDMRPASIGGDSKQRGMAQAILATLGVAASRAVMAYVGKQIGEYASGTTASGAASTTATSSTADSSSSKM